MIIDSLEKLSTYSPLFPQIKNIIDFFAGQSPYTLQGGRISLDGDDLFLSVEKCEGRVQDEAILEGHREYIDIHLPLSCAERFGWSSIVNDKLRSRSYDEHRDLEFYDGKPTMWFDLSPGHFVLFEPGDLHAPLVCEGAIEKIIVKLRVS